MDGHTELAKLLLNHDANINALDSGKYTPLMAAASHCQVSMERFLLGKGAKYQVTGAFYGSGLMALAGNVDRCANQKERATAQALLDGGVPIDAVGREGKTALHEAAGKKDVPYTKLLVWLLKNGANPNQQDNSGQGPLEFAISSGNLEVARILLGHGADPNLADESGMTPLHRAAWNLNLKAAQLLLDHGADPGHESRRGITPLEWVDESLGGAEAQKPMRALLGKALSEPKRKRK